MKAINHAVFMAWVTATSVIGALEDRAHAARSDERGEISSTVITIAVLAGLALAAGAIITAKVTSKANSIPTS